MTSTRCTAAERKGFARYARDLQPARQFNRMITPTEPALGTLAERLDTIVRRHPGPPKRVVLTPAERAELARYQEAA